MVKKFGSAILAFLITFSVSSTYAKYVDDTAMFDRDIIKGKLILAERIRLSLLADPNGISNFEGSRVTPKQIFDLVVQAGGTVESIASLPDYVEHSLRYENFAVQKSVPSVCVMAGKEIDCASGNLGDSDPEYWVEVLPFTEDRINRKMPILSHTLHFAAGSNEVYEVRTGAEDVAHVDMDLRRMSAIEPVTTEVMDEMITNPQANLNLVADTGSSILAAVPPEVEPVPAFNEAVSICRHILLKVYPRSVIGKVNGTTARMTQEEFYELRVRDWTIGPKLEEQTLIEGDGDFTVTLFRPGVGAAELSAESTEDGFQICLPRLIESDDQIGIDFHNEMFSPLGGDDVARKVDGTIFTFDLDFPIEELRSDQTLAFAIEM